MSGKEGSAWVGIRIQSITSLESYSLVKLPTSLMLKLSGLVRPWSWIVLLTSAWTWSASVALAQVATACWRSSDGAVPQVISTLEALQGGREAGT